jgi:AraC-like DNA-binding protein
MVVKQEFESAGVAPVNVTMGEVELADVLTETQAKKIAKNLSDLGFEILDDRAKKTIEKIKTLLIAKVQSGEIEEHLIISEFLSRQLNKEYTQLSRLFSEIEGLTIELFFILQKIEKVKEWLIYNELTLSEIAWKLGYSSVAHLSNQFKKVTGLTPSHFKQIGYNRRKSIDNV